MIPNVSSRESRPSVPQKEGAEEEEEIDIDLGDPEVEAAAIKIQSTFKDFKARKASKATVVCVQDHNYYSLCPSSSFSPSLSRLSPYILSSLS